jgi:hypothetical protein
MGLDIYFYKHTTANDLNDIEGLTAERKESRKAKFPMDKINELIKNNDKKGLIEILKPYNVYGFELKRLEECDDADIQYWVNEIISSYASYEDMYYRKVNFLYAFFKDKLDNEECYVTRHDCEKIIKFGELILETRDLDFAKKLLPTQSGFFFGGTEYDDYYFMDVKDAVEQFKEYLEDWTDDTMGWVYFSW